jgi:hypothetical protein
MATTIQISKELKDALDKQKFTEKETYEEVVWDLLEDRMELSEQTKKAIEQAEQNIADGNTISLAALKRKYGLR